MPTFSSPLPFGEAVQKLGERSVVGSLLSSADWRDVPVGLRERGFFSAGIENVRFLQRGKDLINDFLTSARDPVTGALKVGSRAEFVRLMQNFALAEGMGPLDPSLAGGLRDITSNPRLSMIFDVQTKAAADYGNWRQGMDPDVLNAFPAQRFIRVREVKVPRPDHEEHEGDVELKTNLDWWIARNADFGVPWGPWGFNSGMDVEDVNRRDAEALDLIEPGDVLEPAEEGMNDRLQASTEGLDQPFIDLLKKYFGNQIEVTGNTVKWTKAARPQPQPAPVVAPPTPAPVNPAPAAPAPAPAPEVRSVDEMLKKLGLDAGAPMTADTARALIEELRETNRVPLGSVLAGPVQAPTRALEAKITTWAEEFVQFFPKELRDVLPELTIIGAKNVGARGDYASVRLGGAATVRVQTTYSEAEMRSTVFHEMMHWVHIDGPQWYRDAINGHWAVRTAGENTISFLPKYLTSGKRDQWYELYAGAEYSAAPYRGIDGIEVPTRYAQLLAMDPQDLATWYNDPATRETLNLVLLAFFPGP